MNEETAGGERSDDTAVRTVERRFYVDKLKGLNRHFYVDGGSTLQCKIDYMHNLLTIA